jgi:tetraacyldisaccharide 4'-kinase
LANIVNEDNIKHSFIFAGLMKLLRIISFPIALIYGLMVTIYHWLYNRGVLSSNQFSIPVISIGNLVMGGSGKTPHIEYLIRILVDNNYKVAVLSRGYKRQSSGYAEVETTSNSANVGDEPLQIKKKFPNILVSCDADRVEGITIIKKNHPEIDVVLLDDAYQHRAVKPGLNILLTDFFKPFSSDRIFPMGNLREFSFGKKRADVVVFTKSPDILSPIERRRLNDEVKLGHNQQSFFSYVKYSDALPMPGTLNKDILGIEQLKKCSVVLLTGIANAEYLKYFVQSNSSDVVHFEHADHYQFMLNDIKKVTERIDEWYASSKIILTTEKDMMRLIYPEILDLLKNYPVYYLPIEVAFHGDDEHQFNDLILNYVRKNKANG